MQKRGSKRVGACAEKRQNEEEKAARRGKAERIRGRSGTGTLQARTSLWDAKPWPVFCQSPSKHHQTQSLPSAPLAACCYPPSVHISYHLILTLPLAAALSPFALPCRTLFPCPQILPFDATVLPSLIDASLALAFVPPSPASALSQ